MEVSATFWTKIVLQTQLHDYRPMQDQLRKTSLAIPQVVRRYSHYGVLCSVSGDFMWHLRSRNGTGLHAQGHQVEEHIATVGKIEESLRKNCFCVIGKALYW